MNITVKVIKENEDGSADAKVNFDKEGLECLIQWGLVSMLTKGLDEYKVRPEKADFPVKKRVAKIKGTKK
jgi:hypothetical protein